MFQNIKGIHRPHCLDTSDFIFRKHVEERKSFEHIAKLLGSTPILVEGKYNRYLRWMRFVAHANAINKG